MITKQIIKQTNSFILNFISKLYDNRTNGNGLRAFEKDLIKVYCIWRNKRVKLQGQVVFI